MPEKNTAEIVEWYGKLAGGYDDLYAEEQSSKYEAALKAVAGQDLGTVVDLACGTGLFLDKLLQLCHFAVGVDVAREMLDRARKKGGGDIGFVRADCSALPLKDGMADHVFAISLLKVGELLPGQLSEMARITGHHGIVVGTVFGNGDERRLPEGTGLADDASWWVLSSRELLFRVGRASFKKW